MRSVDPSLSRGRRHIRLPKSRILPVVPVHLRFLDLDALALATRTELAILLLSGSSIEDRGDHLIIRTPTNPEFHWGNALFVTAAARVDDAEHWRARFAAAFPRARHMAIGLVTTPSPVRGLRAWDTAGLTIEHEDAQTTSEPPSLRPLADGYTVHALASADDWAQALRLDLTADEGVLANERQREFQERRLQARQRLTANGHAAFFGAFADDRLVAALGIVDCGRGIARYQHVVTAPENRRQGLTSHLLGVAARWAGDRGCSRWVIVADAGSAAARLYHRCGFSNIERLTQAYREAPPEPSTA